MISVIVPIYNVEKYLESCIDSITNQTYKNIEIILVNDGSTDSSLSICEKYANLDKRIKIINKSNGGLSSARNAGLDIAKGDYISFIDSDDIIELNFLEILFENIKKFNADISQCSFRKLYESEQYEYIDNTYNNYDIKIIDKHGAIENLYNKNYIKTVVFWNKLYKKQIFDDLRFKENIINEDEELIYKVLYKIDKLVDIDIEMYNYLIRNDSIMGESITKKNLDIINIMEDRIIFFENKNEQKLKRLTLVTYLRILIDLCTKFHYSCIENKKEIVDMIINKIDQRKLEFKNNEYNTIICKNMISLYIINKYICFFINKNLFIIKKCIHRDR